jgi:hypothetical protein
MVCETNDRTKGSKMVEFHPELMISSPPRNTWGASTQNYPPTRAGNGNAGETLSQRNANGQN